MELTIGEAFEKFILSFEKNGEKVYLSEIDRMIARGERSLYVDFMDLIQFAPELHDVIIFNPGPALAEFDNVLEMIIKKRHPDMHVLTRYHVRFYNLGEMNKVNLRKIRSDRIGHLIAVSAIVTRMSAVKPMLKIARMKCLSCGNTIDVDATIARHLPTQCPHCEQKTLRFDGDKSVYIDWQAVRLQELPEELPPGQLPRTLDAELKEDLVDTIRPGDRVEAVGILHVIQKGEERHLLFDTRLEVLSLRPLTYGSAEELKITDEDIEKIKQIAKDEFVYEKLKNSIAPAIKGMDDIKASICAALFGGVSRLVGNTHIRGTINILLVGDPSTGKSQLIKYAALLAPRGIFTTGKGASAAGLTAAVTRDQITGEWMLEAGVVVLADGGVAAVDEIDKMDPKDRVALHEAMESQTVTIAKAGIVATLNARTSIIAAANPKGGLYDRSRTFFANTNLPVTILSRFDLYFPVLDVPDRQRDSEVADHVLRSRMQPEIIQPDIPLELLRKYILYAQRINPVITEEASEEIKRYYVSMRLSSSEDRRAIFVRQLESIIRLAEAHARMRLSDKVTRDDALRAISLMEKSLRLVATEDGRVIDATIIATGTTKKQRDVIRVVVSIIEELQGRVRPVKISQIMEKAVELGLLRSEVEDAIEILYKDGEIYKPSTDEVRLL
ncbi:MAG: minichromosome maintenance protein MCM [Candidatus Korarchaeota archaeon]